MTPRMAEQLRDPGERVLLRPAPSSFQTDVYAAEVDGRRYIIKDCSKRLWFLRFFVVRRILQHELRVMYRLRHVPGVPRVSGFLGADALVMEFIDGQGTLVSHRETSSDEFPPLSFFQQLELVVTAMHEKGVAHGDIRRRNILVTDQGPCLIDFGTAVRRQGGLSRLRRRLFEFLRCIDQRKVLKLRALYYPDSLDEQELEELNRCSSWLRLGRFLRRKIYRPLLKQKRWQRRLALWRWKTGLVEQAPPAAPPAKSHAIPKLGNSEKPVGNEPIEAGKRSETGCDND